MTELLRNKFEEIEKHIGGNEDNSFCSSDEEVDDKFNFDDLSKIELIKMLYVFSSTISDDLDDYKTIIDKLRAYKAKLIHKQNDIESGCKTLGKIKTILEVKYNHKIE